MAELLNVSPTRGELLRLKDDVAGIRTRHDLLDRKREILVRELMDRLQKADELEKTSQECFRKAHEAVQLARMYMGSDRVGWVSLSPTVRVDMTVDLRSIMGLDIPAVDMDIKPVDPAYGFGYTSASLDEAREKWLDVLRFLADASEIFTSVWRLAMELRKVQRQVNALESTIIPRYERTISYIQERLEEEEREDIVHAKKVKEMQQRGT